MSLTMNTNTTTKYSFPRLRGDEPALDLTLDNETEFSPPTRG